MAITETATPDTVSAAYRPILYTATSDDSTIVRMIADVKIDNVVKASIDKDPRIGTTDTFDFDVQQTVQDFITYDLKSIAGNSIVNAASSEVEIKLDLYEVLETTANLLSTAWKEDGTGTPDLTSTQIWGVGATLQHEETQNLNAFTVDDSTKKFTTNAPTTLRIGTDETIQLHFLTGKTNTRYRLKQYDTDGALLSNALSSVYGVATDKAGILLLSEKTMLAATTQFTVQLEDNSSNIISELRTFNIDSSIYDQPVRLKWLNPFGGFDSYTFSAKKTWDLRHSSKTFEKPLDFAFSVDDRGREVQDIRLRDSFQIWSRLEARATIQWLMELGASTQVFIDDGTNFVPIIITSRKASGLDTEDEILQASFKYEYANNRMTQRN